MYGVAVPSAAPGLMQASQGDGAVYSQLSSRTYFREYKYLVDLLGMAQDMQALASRTLFVPNNYGMAQVGA